MLDNTPMHLFLSIFNLIFLTSNIRNVKITIVDCRAILSLNLQFKINIALKSLLSLSIQLKMYS